MSTARLHLWEISEAEEALAERLAEAEGELTPELEAEFDSLAGSFEDKAERIALYARELEANAKAAREEEARLAGIRKALDRKATKLKDYLRWQMEKTGRHRVETPKARIRIQDNSRPSIRWTGSLDALPEGFRKVTVAPDTALAYEAWQDMGEAPEGFVVEQGRHLRIY